MKKMRTKIVNFALIALMLSNMAYCLPDDKKPIVKEDEKKQSLYFSNLSDEQYTQLKKMYKKVTDDEKLIYAVELLSSTPGEFSRNAILGKNLTMKPVKIEFRNLGEMSKKHASFDALGYKRKNKLYIYINQKHEDAPPSALAALLAHEAIHQDEFNSLNEETYAWTLEAVVWYNLSKKFPEDAKKMHPLVNRENTLKMLLEKGDYTDKYIRKSVYSNPGYSNLNSRSPGFEDPEEKL